MELKCICKNWVMVLCLCMCKCAESFTQKSKIFVSVVEDFTSQGSCDYDNHLSDEEVETSLLSWRLNPAPLDNIDEPVQDYGQGDHSVGDVDKVKDDNSYMATFWTEVPYDTIC